MAQQQADTKILIVGAGPTGLTAALELARRGVTPRIIDRKDAPTPLSKAVGISPHSLDVLEPSGISERLLDKGLRIRHVHFSEEGRELGVVYISSLPHRFNFLLSLPQRDTETIMVGRLAELGVGVEWRSSLYGLKESAEGVDARIATPDGQEEARFDLVFGADGVDSAVRKALGIEFQGYTHKREWSIADAEIADWPYEPLSAQAFLHRNGDVGFIIPIEEGRFRAVSNTDDALARIPGNYRVTELLRTDRFHIPARQAQRYQTNRIFLGGDAAHAHSPVGARGMNLGIEDSASFARRFFDGTLAGYTAERWPIGKRWIALSERILRTAQTTSPTAQTFRNLAFSVIGRFPALQRPFIERIAGLKE
ncbi:2-polyprenyl-6-methoxyphenol hydroxylase-like FAD-dependent oxidoreductase [Mesorhizobium soli]|uniref:FAD-dependent oxidoreductase n=1 Tax=Pseudaminobacter soli (ex Li et al. 2025) TaxID=1295366 RepID=UPI0024769AC9|nr:FAD-dependent monooxygenase [Mesorhizobium soli]MDH6230554.1 2-polyprenyl-6-methoxyphenol hydroxylase-like FAD-dependent oxidoreductase [Mesorhizobium soli]